MFNHLCQVLPWCECRVDFKDDGGGARDHLSYDEDEGEDDQVQNFKSHKNFKVGCD